MLRAAADTGTVNIWVAFHGVGEVHDRQVNRSGAYAETCLAVERARSAGLSVGGNVFLTTASLAQLDELTAVGGGCRSTRPSVLKSRASCRPRGLGGTSSCARPCPTCCRMPPGWRS